jgi:hypothetical protein
MTFPTYYPIYFLSLLVLYVALLNYVYQITNPNIKLSGRELSINLWISFFLLACAFGSGVISYYMSYNWQHSLTDIALSKYGWFILIFERYVVYGYTGFMVARFIKRK